MLYQHTDTYTVQVIAKNEVSTINKSVDIEVVCKYTYITTGFLHCNHCFLVTNASVIISFSLSSLNSTNVNYESTFWMDKLVVIIDNQITNVRKLF